MNRENKLHIAIIIIGIIFLLIPVFHSNMWFDESYSVAISNHSFSEIWTIGSNDVHPVLYYWILHIINIIFGNNIVLYRLFSVLCISVVGILGYTHIRKDFGEKTGILFSLLAFFLPVNVVYAGEIRMYALAMLNVTLMSIYAYRIYIDKDKRQIKNWVIFGIFSLLSAYTHYYGLMIAGLINLSLFIVFILQAKRQRKFTFNLRAFIFSAVPQVLLYLPWIAALIFQVSGVSKGFWIGIHFPDSYIELLTFPFTGNLSGAEYVALPMAIIFSIFTYGYIIYTHREANSKEIKPAKMAFIYWISILISAYIVSKLMHSTILYARYMFCVGGLFVFFIAHSLSISKKTIVNTVVITTSVVLSILVTNSLVKENYGSANSELQTYLSQNIQENDIIICSNDFSGFIVSALHPENKFYFWDVYDWKVGPAYKAYGETVSNLDFLKEYKGRIWVVNASEPIIYEEINKEYDIKKLEQKQFNVEYKGYQYNLTLIEK